MVAEPSPTPEEATGQPEHQPMGILNAHERQAITEAADVRRRRHELILSLGQLEDPVGPESRRQRYQQIMRELADEASGEATISLEDAALALAQYEEGWRTQLEGDRDTLPLSAATAGALLVKHLQLLDRPFDGELAQTKRAVTGATDTPRPSPAQYRPDAILLGITSRRLRTLPQPPLEHVAEAVMSDSDLVADVGLVLPEEDRQRFLALIPEQQRQSISIRLDRALAPYVARTVMAESDRPTHETIAERATRSLEQASQLADAHVVEQRLIGAVPKVLVKDLTQTLAALDHEDSSRILQQIGTATLASERDAQANERKLSYAARIIRELGEIDQAKGGNLAMKFLAKRDAADRPRLFRYFATKLIQSKYLTQQLEPYLADEANLPFLRKLAAEYLNEFNTVIDTVAELQLNPTEHADEVFGALDELGTLTPTIFRRYRAKETPEAKHEFAEQIRRLKPRFFRNQPIKGILPREDRDILDEMVYQAFRPVGMSFEQVKSLVGRVEDHTDDLAEYRFPAEGYDFSLESQKSYALKTDETLNRSVLQQFQTLLSGHAPEDERPMQELGKVLGKLAKAQSNISDQELALVLSPLASQPLTQQFRSRYPNGGQEAKYNYLTELQEILGVYFKDNYEQVLAEFLTSQPGTLERLTQLLTTPKRQSEMMRQLRDKTRDIDYSRGINWDAINQPTEQAKVLARFINLKLMQPLRQSLKKELGKFEESDQGEVAATSQSNLRLYLSKNAGSFFAKASAGICTAQDIPLFERSDHFHMNVVEGEERVRANIQAYLVTVNGQRALLLRGFNPNVDFLDKIDTSAFIDKVLEVGQQFAVDNGLAGGVYISETLGGWHALSNRAAVNSDMAKRHVRKDRAVSFSFAITDSQSISTIYQIPQPESDEVKAKE